MREAAILALLVIGGTAAGTGILVWLLLRLGVNVNRRPVRTTSHATRPNDRAQTRPTGR